MSKVIILWSNFGSSTSYPSGPVSSSLSLYTSELVDKDIGHQHDICNCGSLKKRSINVTNRRNTHLNIKNIRTHSGRSAVNEKNLQLLKIELFCQLLKQTIKERYTTFDFGNNNMAVFIDEGEQFDVLNILEAFKVKLAKMYRFNAPIRMERVAVVATNKQEVDTIPFINVEDSIINKFIQWASSVCPSLQ